MAGDSSRHAGDSGASASQRIAGVGLEERAGVAAALAEGFALADVLAAEAIEPRVWSVADPAWKQRLVHDAAEGGALWMAYQNKLGQAEDCLARAVAPLDTELRAWLGFLYAWGSAPAPFEMLQKLGLNLNDVSRLKRRWARRMAADRALALEAARISASPPSAPAALTIGKSELRPFPWSRRSVAPPADQPVGSAEPPVDFPLDRYAWLHAEFAERPHARAEVLARFGLDERRYASVVACYTSVLRREELAADFRRLLAHQRARIVAARYRTDPLPAPARDSACAREPARAGVDETAAIGIPALADSDVLPFELCEPRPPPAAWYAPHPESGATATVPALAGSDPLPFHDAASLVDETATVAVPFPDPPLPFDPQPPRPPPPTGLSDAERGLAGGTVQLAASELGELGNGAPFASESESHTEPERPKSRGA